MRRYALALALAIGLTACGSTGGAPPVSVPPAQSSRQVTTLPPVAEQSAAVLCEAYLVAEGTVTRLGRAGRLNQSQVTTVDRIKRTMDPACRGAVTEAVLATINVNLGELLGIQRAVEGARP